MKMSPGLVIKRWVETNLCFLGPCSKVEMTIDFGE